EDGWNWRSQRGIVAARTGARKVDRPTLSPRQESSVWMLSFGEGKSRMIKNPRRRTSALPSVTALSQGPLKNFFRLDFSPSSPSGRTHRNSRWQHVHAQRCLLPEPTLVAFEGA